MITAETHAWAQVLCVTVLQDAWRFREKEMMVMMMIMKKEYAEYATKNST